MTSLVQTAVFESAASPASGQTITINGTTAGNTIVVVAISTGGTTAVNFIGYGLGAGFPLDSVGNNYVPCWAPGISVQSGSCTGTPGSVNVSSGAWYASKIVGGNTTITLNWASGTGTYTIGIYAFEISGGPIVYDAGSGTTGATSLATTGNWTTNFVSDLILSVAFNSGQVAPTSESYTLIQNTATLGACLQYNNAASAGTHTSTATYAASQDWGIVSVAFGVPTFGMPYIAQYGVDENFSGTNSKTIQLTKTTLGNVLCVMAGVTGSGSLEVVTSFSVSDTAGNIWRPCNSTFWAGAQAGLDDGISAEMFYAPITKPGTTTITMSQFPSSINSNNALIGLYAFEIGAANQYDNGTAFANFTNGTTSTLTSGTFTTGYANEIQLGFLANAPNGTITTTISNYTILTSTYSLTTSIFFGNFTQPSPSNIANITVSSSFNDTIVAVGAFYYAPYLPNDPIFFGIT